MQSLWRLLAVLLCFPAVSGADKSSLLDNHRSARLVLPAALLDRLVQGIEFAYSIGAAKEISTKDLGHAHLLYAANRSRRILAKPDVVLFHSQEMVWYGTEAFRLRNIVSRLDSGPGTLACSMGGHLRPFYNPADGTEFCTVDHVDLGMSETSGIDFVPVDGVPAEQLNGYQRNIRTAAGHKVLFVLYGLRPRLYVDR